MYYDKHTNFRYSLGKKGTRCPACGRPKVFKPYIDNENGQPVDEETCGRCNREINCGYHLPPREYFRSKDTTPVSHIYKQSTEKLMQQYYREPFALPSAVRDKVQGRNPSDNPLYRFLSAKFGHGLTESSAVDDVFVMYRVGTSKRFGGSTLFMLYDKNDTFVDGKIMGYSPTTGKRIKQPFVQINWLSSIMSREQNKEFLPVARPFFGEHLIRRCNDGTLMVFESEKTALVVAICLMEIMGPLFYTRFLPVASAGCGMLSPEKMQTLYDWLHFNPKPLWDSARRVVLFPDLGMEELWQKKADIIAKHPGMEDRCVVSRCLCGDGLEVAMSEGDDFADYVLRMLDKYGNARNVAMDATLLVNRAV